MKDGLSDATTALLNLLAQYTRAQIRKALGQHEEPLDALLNGDLVLNGSASRRAHHARASSHAEGGAGVLSIFDAHYPEVLRHIPDPPLIIFVRGAVSALTDGAPKVAVVGARRASRSGRDFAESLGQTLAQAGVNVVSGLAIGVDGAAHRGACLAVHGDGHRACPTIAVLGSGLKQIYPATHTRLAEEILRCGGTLLSEYPDRMTPRAHHFPERNRIISGLANAVVVIEAGARSGSLITARLALEQGREVLAVPGPVTSPLSRGCHRLIRQGAELVESADDVLAALGMVGGEAKNNTAA